MTIKPLITIAAALFGATLASPAHADLVFRFHNLSNIEAKGIMQNVGIVWLRRGQVEEVRAKGDWSGSCMLFGSVCDTILSETYVANFQHLADNNMHQYCVWRIKRTLQLPAPNADSGSVRVTVELEQQDPGYVCSYSGQSWAPYNTGKLMQGKGITVDFSVKNK